MNQKSLDKKKGKELNYSKNEKAEKIVGLRKIPKNAIIFDQPCELDYHCPVCKYKNVVNGNYDERLEWSEYNDFIWCRVCNKDYPTCLCVSDKNKATEIYLSCIEDVVSQAIPKQQILNLECLKEEKLIDDTKVDCMILEKTWEDNDLKVIRNKLRNEIKEEILENLKDIEIGEFEGWDLAHKFNCCPGDDMADAYNQALKDVIKLIKKL